MTKARDRAPGGGGRIGPPPARAFAAAVGHHNAGRLDQADAICMRILSRQPDNGDALNLLGMGAGRRGRMDRAAEWFRRAVGCDGNDPVFRCNLAMALRAVGNGREAEAHYRSAIAAKPDHADAHEGLGGVLASMGRFGEAIDALEAALRPDPKRAAVHGALGDCYWRLGRDREAAAAFEAVLRQAPGDVNAITRLGQIAAQAGDVGDAHARFDEALALAPDWPDALASKTSLYERAGAREDCRAFIEPLIRSERPHPEIIAAYARTSRGPGERDDAVAAVEGALNRDDLPEYQERDLRFALGALHDQAGDFERAFACIEKANAMHPGRFDVKAFEWKVGQVIEFFGSTEAATLPVARSESGLPVFIVGVPRSGTTLTEQILANHRSVHGAGELRSIGDMLRSQSGGKTALDVYPHIMRDLGQAALDRLARGHLAYLAGIGGGAARVIDKMPYNFLFLGFIERVFPGARVVHCVRDSLDTCLSCYFHNFERGNLQTYDLRVLGAYHRRYERLMAFWRARLSIPMLEISYERLVADLEGESRRLVDFLGLEWDPACLEFHRSKRMVQTASHDQVRQPIYTRSVGRWRHYERHIGPLREALDGVT
jgi:tetratricopeptide (TPR) repeat protein